MKNILTINIIVSLAIIAFITCKQCIDMTQENSMEDHNRVHLD